MVAKEPMVWNDCEIDPANLTENDRKELNVTEMLPANLEEALEALKGDEEIVGLLGEELVEKYVAVKGFELGLLGKMSKEERKRWMMARY